MTRPLRDAGAGCRATRPRPVAGCGGAVRSRDEIGQLAGAFNGMAADLQRAQDDLVAAAKFASVGEIAAGLAHEIRTPLGIMRGSAQMLEPALGAERPAADRRVGRHDRSARSTGSSAWSRL